MAFYILESRAGAPSQPSLPFSSMADLKPKKGIVYLEAIDNENSELRVHYSFATPDPDRVESFIVTIPGIPTNAIKLSEGEMHFEHLEGLCDLKGEKFDYKDVSIHSIISSGEKTGSLSICGYVNNKLFSVEILSATTDEPEEDSSGFYSFAVVDYALYVEISFTNKSKETYSLTMNYNWGEADTITLKPNEEYTLRKFSIEEGAFWGSYCTSITLQPADGCDHIIYSMPFNKDYLQGEWGLQQLNSEWTYLLQGEENYIVKRPYMVESFEIR